MAFPTRVSVAAGRDKTADPRVPVTGWTLIAPVLALWKETAPTEVLATPRVRMLTPSVVKPASVWTSAEPFPITRELAVRLPSLFVTVPEPPPPEGAAKVPSPRKKVVVLFGGVGTRPPTVDVIVAIARPFMVVQVATPSVGVVKEGEAEKTKWPVPVAPVLVTPSIVGCPESVGDAIVGEEPKTSAPVPVASDMIPSSWEDVVEAKALRLLLVKAKVPPEPKFRVEPSVPAKVMVLLTVRTFPDATLIDTAARTPRLLIRAAREVGTAVPFPSKL